MRSKITNIYLFAALSVLLGSFALAAEPTTLLILSMNYNEGKITINSIEKAKGYYPQSHIIEDYLTYKIYNFNDEQLFSTAFEIPFERHIDPSDIDKGFTDLDSLNKKFDFAVVVPYTKDSAKIKVSNAQGRVLAEREISQYTGAKPKASLLKIFLVLAIVVIALAIAAFLVRRKNYHKS